MAPTLQSVFEAYSAFGSRDPAAAASGLDGKNFSKWCKEAGLVKAPKFTSVDVDLLFTRAKGKGAKKMTFNQFEGIIGDIATKMKIEPAAVANAFVQTGGPKNNGTKAESVRFFDDKSTFTGVHAHGGPSTVDGAKDLSGLCDRSPADRRGNKIPAKH